jgi:hypothetical protein
MINREICQDTTVPTSVFHSAYISLTQELNKSEYGHQIYGTGREANHLLYIDDLKLIGGSGEELRKEIKIEKQLA